ncbi:Hypothetical protein GLP15_1598 [Giardia lamblia P15]|uniref:Uncharacterized protein n=1 Tax=Giardia intestinalis (strain P15) TaxID=658858 RepID=E1EX77_GIAIA|nr:Hypothetical protein GLP15_1598 [Giardia lamblia P15]
MEPLPFRTMLDPAAMALSDSSSGEQEESSSSIFTTKCPLDYCSRTTIQLSFSSCSSTANCTRIVPLLKRAYKAVFGDRYLGESEMIQKYLLSDSLLVLRDRRSKNVRGIIQGTQPSDLQITDVDVDKESGDDTCSHYVYKDVYLLLQTIQEGLRMYVSISGSALYTRPYSVILDDLFHIAQLSQKAASEYVDKQRQDNKRAVRTIIADISAYRRALLDCYKHISKLPFVIILGSNFEALFGHCDELGKDDFCMVSGYPGIIEALEHALRHQSSKVEQTLKNIEGRPQHAPYHIHREGSFIYIVGDITLATDFFLYKIPLSIGLHGAEKSLPRIYSMRPFECSYQSTDIAYTIAEDDGLFSIDCYMPFFSVKQVVEGLQRAMTAVSSDCRLLAELSAPTQHSRNFNYPTLFRTDGTSEPSQKNSTSSIHSFLKQLSIDAKGFVSYY